MKKQDSLQSRGLADKTCQKADHDIAAIIASFQYFTCYKKQNFKNTQTPA
jgi:hypothetical protein